MRIRGTWKYLEGEKDGLKLIHVKYPQQNFKEKLNCISYLGLGFLHVRLAANSECLNLFILLLQCRCREPCHPLLDRKILLFVPDFTGGFSVRFLVFGNNSRLCPVLQALSALFFP